MSLGDQPVERLFEEALQHALPDERAQFLDRACGSDFQLRQRVEKLLRGHEDAGTFLEAPPAEIQERLSRLSDQMAAQTEKAGDRIGRYLLLEQIGEGSFGDVWMAEQEQPVRRRVALKIIKLGMNTKEVVARFEAERQALALMNHPSIATVFDVGATGSGRPYFVMELVKGVPLTKYCDDARLSKNERLELFSKVCQAVQHAHQKGIIHRDLKPFNILVADLDGRAVPKVIDFGVAKATEARLTDKTLFTRFGQMIGTPDYMSPEQTTQGGLDIDTRTDVYALGAVLYELLTGRTPIDRATLLQAGFEAIGKTIRETEPPKPSTRLSTLNKDELSTIAHNRRVEPTRLNRLVHGELDWIVMKALEKDRTRRYESVSAFAQDIDRHLRQEPVMAVAPSASYQLQKFARRHKGALAVGSVVAATVLIGGVVSVWQAVRATRAERLASREASVRGQVAQFFSDMIAGIDPSVAKGRDTTVLREMLERSSLRIGTDLKDQPEVAAELEATLASAYIQLGDYEKSATLLRDAAEQLGKLPKQEQSVAQILNNLAAVLNRGGKPAEAEKLHREVLAMRKRLLGNDHEDVGESLNNLAAVLWNRGNLTEAETMYGEAFTVWRKRYGEEHQLVYTSLNNLALVLADQGKLAEAETMFGQVLAMEVKLLGNEHQDVASTLNNLALVLADQGKLEQAEKIYREMLPLQRKLLNNEHPEVAKSLHNLSRVLYEEKKTEEAEKLARDALAMRKKLLTDEHPDIAESFNSLAEMLQAQGKLVESESLSRQCLMIREKESPNDWRTFNTRRLLGSNLLEQRKYAEAEALLLSGYEGMMQREETIPADHKACLSETAEQLVRLYELQSMHGKAEEWKKQPKRSSSSARETKSAQRRAE